MRPCRRLALVSLGAILPVLAHAQRPDTLTASRLPVMEVRASIAPTAGPAVASGVPARIARVGGDAIDAWRPRVLPELLGAQAGVSYYDDLGTPWKLNLSTRGFTVGPTVGLPAGVTVFLDGIRQNEADAQEVNFDLLPTDDVDHIELLSGTASLLGPNSLGGAINLVTARGFGAASSSVSSSLGSFGNYHGRGDVSGGSSGGLNYRASVDVGTERGWREATGNHSYNLFFNGGHERANEGVQIQGFTSRSRAETAGSLPESIYASAPRINFTPGDFEDIDARQLSVAAHRHVAAGEASLSLYGRGSSAERFNVNQPPDANVRGFTSATTLGGTTDWRWVASGAGRTSLRIGVDGSASRVRVRIFNEAQPTVDPAVPLGANDPETGLTTDVKSPTWSIAAYAIGDYGLGRVSLSGGARADRVRVPFQNVLNMGDNTANTFSRISPRVGANVVLGRGLSAYASAGTGFRAPAILELGCADPEAACPLPFALGDDPPLAPVISTTYEAGARWLGSGVAASASLYRTNVRHEIFFVASEDALLSGYFTNLDRTRRQGIEASVNGNAVASRLDWFANYAYTSATFQSPAQLFSIRSDDDFGDSPLAGDNDVRPGDCLPLVPRHQVKAGASLRFERGLSAGLDTRYIGRQWLRGDEANQTAPLDPYVLVGARTGVRWRTWNASLVVANLFNTERPVFGTFNENRATEALERFLTPANTRTFMLELRRSFGAIAP